MRYRSWGIIIPFVAKTLLAQTPEQLSSNSVKIEGVTYRGRSAVRITADGRAPNGDYSAVVKGADFRNGTIDVDLVGLPAAGSPPSSRGFIGVAFHLQNGKYEYIYLRP